MGMYTAPAYTSYTVLVHAGSYKNFVAKLEKEFPNIEIKFSKVKAVHYYVLQLEDHTSPDVPAKKLYELPLMAIREEFSKFIVFKSTKAYNNVLRIMCNAKDNKEAGYTLFEEMLTPYEKMAFSNMFEAKKLKYTLKNVETTIFSQTEIVSNKTLTKLFELNEIELDDKEVKYLDLVKEKDWKVGIC